VNESDEDGGEDKGGWVVVRRKRVEVIKGGVCGSVRDK
jgi:hypothetical protein